MISDETAVGGTLEHQIARSGQRAAIPGRHVLDSPSFLSVHRIPSQEASERQALSINRVHHEADIPAGDTLEFAGYRLILNEGFVGQHVNGHILRRQIDQSGLWIE